MPPPSMMPANFTSPWRLSMIQLGSIGADKTRNLVHAREMVVRAAKGEKDGEEKADLVMLPVSSASDS